MRSSKRCFGKNVYLFITPTPSPYISQNLENKTPDLGIGDLSSEIFKFKGDRGKIFKRQLLAVSFLAFSLQLKLSFLSASVVIGRHVFKERTTRMAASV
jgi:hypothetical protein